MIKTRCYPYLVNANTFLWRTMLLSRGSRTVGSLQAACNGGCAAVMDREGVSRGDIAVWNDTTTRERRRSRWDSWAGVRLTNGRKASSPRPVAMRFFGDFRGWPIAPRRRGLLPVPGAHTNRSPDKWTCCRSLWATLTYFVGPRRREAEPFRSTGESPK